MPLLNPTLDRRTFLGSACASVAFAVTQTAANGLLPRAPMAVNAVMQGANALAGLQAVLENPHLDLCTVLLAGSYPAADRSSTGEDAQGKLASDVHRLLVSSNSKVPVFELRQGSGGKRSFGPKFGLPMLLLGSFPGYGAGVSETNGADQHPLLTRLLRNSPYVYVDDPLLAIRIARLPTLRALAPRTVVGLCSPLDPAVEFAVTHLRSGEIGSITQVSASLRVRDASNRVEARSIHDRWVATSTSGSFPPLQLAGVASVQPTITLCGTRGRLRIALYTGRDRSDMLPLRLRHFVSIARGDAEQSLD